MATDELKPCPFCGGEASLIPPMQGSTWEQSWHVRCLNDGCYADCQVEDKAEAIANWNTRTGERNDG